MGEFTDNGDIKQEVIKPENGYSTDVPDVMADEIQIDNNEEFPVFNVCDRDFYQNMTVGRKRLRFRAGTNAQKYHQGTKYNRPFYIKYTNNDGNSFMRKIK